MLDPYNLERFVAAQEHSYSNALSELRNGRKLSHWMWFVFPQIKGLGSSNMAQKYAISGVDEAKAYAAHFVLGGRLIECCKLLLQIQDRSAQDIFGEIDAIKLHSSMTLFAQAVAVPAFSSVLSKYYAGRKDVPTLKILNEVHG